MNVLKFIMLVFAIGLFMGCSDSSTGSQNLNLTGTWSGTGSDSSGPGEISWDITHNDGEIEGTISMVDESSGITGTGTVSGTLSGSSLSFTMTIPQGGFSSPFSSCSATLSGTANDVTNSRIKGTYSGSNSCSGSVSNGEISLNLSSINKSGIIGYLRPVHI